MLLMYADVEVMTTFATWMKPGTDVRWTHPIHPSALINDQSWPILPKPDAFSQIMSDP